MAWGALCPVNLVTGRVRATVDVGTAVMGCVIGRRLYRAGINEVCVCLGGGCLFASSFLFVIFVAIMMRFAGIVQESHEWRVDENSV